MKLNILAVFTLFICLLGLSSCGDSAKEKGTALSMLQEAKEALNNGSYEYALEVIDSLHKSFPKDFKEREEAAELKNEIIVAQAQDLVASADTSRITLQQQIKELKSELSLVRDRKYEDIGHYFASTQLESANQKRSYLCAQVSEDGVFILTSIYRGNGFIRHNRIRVGKSNDSFVETEPGSGRVSSNRSGKTSLSNMDENSSIGMSKDNSYSSTLRSTTLPRTSVLGTPKSKDDDNNGSSAYSDNFGSMPSTSEKIDYLTAQGADSVAAYIARFHGNNLKCVFLGAKPTSVALTLADQRDIIRVWNLYQKMKTLSEITKKKDDALLKIRFYTTKMKRKELGKALKGEK
ncbi:MAG: hypothetical protein WCQ86_04590 [Bacteroidaceae bacterium]